MKTDDKEFTKYKDVVNLIFAGFPCQGFSNAGKKKINDPRNTLFKEFLRATKIIKPKYIIGENVKGLLTRKTETGEKYIDIIVREFQIIGYNVKDNLDASIIAFKRHFISRKLDHLMDKEEMRMLITVSKYFKDIRRIP